MATQIQTTAGEVRKACERAATFHRRVERLYRDAIDRYFALPLWRFIFAIKPEPWSFDYRSDDHERVEKLFFLANQHEPSTVMFLDVGDAVLIHFDTNEDVTDDDQRR